MLQADVVRLAPALDRDTIMGKLAERGIPARPYFCPLHMQPVYEEVLDHREGDFPVTERVGRSTLALPLWGKMTEGHVERVCEVLGESV